MWGINNTNRQIGLFGPELASIQQTRTEAWGEAYFRTWMKETLSLLWLIYQKKHQNLTRGVKLWVVKIWTVINMVLWPEKNRIWPPIILPTKLYYTLRGQGGVFLKFRSKLILWVFLIEGSNTYLLLLVLRKNIVPSQSYCRSKVSAHV